MYQQIPPPPYQPSSYQPPCPPYSYQQPYPPYGDPSGAQPPHRGGLRAWAVVLIALGTFFSGTFYDVSFSACSFDADVTLTSYLRGDQAADKILEMGGDLSGLPDGMEYVTATFQIKLHSTDSSTAVMFNPQYFRFDIVESGDDVRIGNYPENGVEVENVSLKAGESGSVTAFAVIDEAISDPDLYFYTSDTYLTFTP